MPHWTAVAIAVCQIIMTAMFFLVSAALIVVLIWFKGMIERKINDAMARVQPIINQAKAISDDAKETVDKVSSTVDTVMTRVESSAGQVGDRLDSIMEKVETASGQINTTLENITSQVNTTVGSIMDRADNTAGRVTGAVDTIVHKAETTADNVSNSVSGAVYGASKKVEASPQMATAASLVGTAVRVFEIYRDISKMRQAREVSTTGPQQPQPSVQTDVDIEPGPPAI